MNIEPRNTSKKEFYNTKDNMKKDNSQEYSERSMIIANVLNTEYDVIKEVLENVMKYKLSYEPEDENDDTTKEWDLYWNDLIITPKLLAKMKPYQKVNHFPGMEALFLKNLLGKNLMKMRKVFPAEYAFFPPTWSLPDDWEEFKNQFNGKARTFIIKPEDSSQGRGIYLTRRWDCIGPEEHCVAQRYLARPFLIDGLKFDLRIYVLVYGCDPYRVYMFKEGLARLATEPYTIPKGSNLGNQYMHLTNYAINKNSKQFQFNTDANNADTGHKRSLEYVWKYINENGGDSASLILEVKKCIVKTLCAVQPQLSKIYRENQPNDIANDKCFEILGFDIMFDQKFRPCLLEVNHAPSFNTDTPFDRKVKFELIRDTFRIINLNPEAKIQYNKEQEKGKIFDINITREEIMKKRANYEINNLGNFELIYPNKEYELEYERYIRVAASTNLDMEAIKEIQESAKHDEQKKQAEINNKEIYSGAKTIQNNNKVQKRLTKNTRRVFKAKEEVKSVVIAGSPSLENVNVPNYSKPRNGLGTNPLQKNTIPEKEQKSFHVPDIKKVINSYERNAKEQNNSLILFSKLKRSVAAEKRPNGQMRKAGVITYYKQNERTVMSNKGGNAEKSVSYGSYIAPKMIEFSPIDIISPLKIPILSNNKWNPYRGYKPNIKMQKLL